MASTILTTPQLITFAQDIAASEFGALPHDSASAVTIADAYNLAANPTYIVWKDFVALHVVGHTFDGGDLGNMTSANSERLRTFASWQVGSGFEDAGVIPSRADHRVFFDDVFSGAAGATTRGNLDALWKRQVNRIERLYTTGVGSDGDPGILGYEGAISRTEVFAAWNANE